MISRGWWPLQRWMAVRPVLTLALAGAGIIAIAALWRPSAAVWPAALASVVALLAPVVLACGDGSRRRLAGRATGAALAIAQPLILGALLVDVELLIPIAAASVIAVLLPAVLPLRAPATCAELAPEPALTRTNWLVPLAALASLVVVMAIRGDLHIAVPDLDTRMVTILVACTALWIGISLRPLLGLLIAAAMILAFVLATSQVATPMTVALAMAPPLVAWFRRESAGGFSTWSPAVICVGTTAAYAPDPAGPMLALLSMMSWLVAATYPAVSAATEPVERSGAGVIAWSRRLFAGLEPYWRVYARAKLVRDPVYGRLADSGRAWGSVLDAGCGPGLTAVLATGRGDTTAYLGIDLDIDKLLVARRALHLSGRCIGGDWRLRRERLPVATLPTERFDTVLVLDVLHYWPPDQQAATLAQLASLLDTDGRLYLREGVADGDGDAGKISRGERFTTYFGLNPETPLTFLSAGRIDAMIAGAGLAVESAEPMGSENRLWICRRAQDRA